ncbi:hypothetical protein [Gluconobacter wancherniae]|uniref:hypothetical protein n=1 Tax=Gluconobacter wancherniae TaxID=1307955 RepID=UPI0020111485|nr:hypothetical protein [Gluconobacter wancherniae]
MCPDTPERLRADIGRIQENPDGECRPEILWFVSVAVSEAMRMAVPGAGAMIVACVLIVAMIMFMVVLGMIMSAVVMLMRRHIRAQL